MEDKEDLESAKNHSSSPLLNMDTILLEFLNLEDEVWINTKTNMATSLAAEANSNSAKIIQPALAVFDVFGCL